MEHIFNVQFAKDYGIEDAILIENLFNENKIVQVSVIIEMYIYMPYVYVSLIEYIRKNKIDIFNERK